MIILILLISFALEGIFSNLLSANSILIPLFTIISFVIVYPYFKNEKNKFYIYAGLIGLLYDIVYTNCPFVNTFTFLITSLMISLIYEYITVSKFNVTLIKIIILLFYQTISYIVLCFFSYTTFNETTLLTTLYSSIIINVIYGFLLFILVSFLDKKHKIRKMY